MKNYLYATACLLSCLILLNSCATSSISKAERKATFANSKEPSVNCFVKMNDGTIKEYSTLKLVTAAFTTPYLLADGKTKIKPNEIISYQNADHYAISQKIICCGKKSHVAKETLPGFAIRTVKGKLNVYCKKYYNGQVAIDEYFLQANDGLIKAYSTELMNELVKDNSEAYIFFNNKKFKGRLPEKLQATAHLYNGGQMISKN